MDVSEILAAHVAKQKLITVEKDIPLEIDAGFLTVTDLNPGDAESYDESLEEYLLSTARDGVQALVSSLFALPITSSADGPLARLPSPTTQLPRAKPLPKPKPLTKWEKFAKAKGIQKQRKDKKVWDEEKQEWVDRWGWKGANKREETQWLSEVPANADADYDPAKIARGARKEKMAKNERQHQQNLVRAQAANMNSSTSDRFEHKKGIDRTLATARTSTASMGRFDRTLDGEKRLKGLKRKFSAAEVSATAEKSQNLAILKNLDREPIMKKAKSSKEAGGDVLNIRKAIRSVSKGKGNATLARSSTNAKTKRGRR